MTTEWLHEAQLPGSDVEEEEAQLLCDSVEPGEDASPTCPQRMANLAARRAAGPRCGAQEAHSLVSSHRKASSRPRPPPLLPGLLLFLLL